MRRAVEVFAVFLFLLSGEALAQAVTAAPFSIDGIKALIPVILVAALGGVVSFYQKVRTGKARVFNFTELIGELVTAGFAGILTYWLCQYANINQWATAALVGIAGHAGSRALFVIEKLLESKFPAVNLKGDGTDAGN